MFFFGIVGDWLIVDFIEFGLFWGYFCVVEGVGILFVVVQKSMIVLFVEWVEIGVVIWRGDDGGFVFCFEIMFDGCVVDFVGVCVIGYSGVYEVVQYGFWFEVMLVEVVISEFVYVFFGVRSGFEVLVYEEVVFFWDVYFLFVWWVVVCVVGCVEFLMLLVFCVVFVLLFLCGDIVWYVFEWDYFGFGWVLFLVGGEVVCDMVVEDFFCGRIWVVWME